MSTKTFVCLFCQSSEGKRSREHVLRKAFNKTAPKDLIDTELVTTRIRESDETPSERVSPMSQFDVQVNSVCTDCNSGWLNDLEAAVAPFMLWHLTVHGSMKVPAVDEHLLGLWMTTRALMRTCTEGRGRQAPNHLFHEVYTTRRVPRGCFVQSAYVDTYVLTGGRCTYESDAGGENYSACVSFGFGFLFFQTFLTGGGPSSRALGTALRRDIRKRFPAAFKMVAPFDNAHPWLASTLLTGGEARAAAQVFSQFYIDRGFIDPKAIVMHPES